MRKRKYSIVDTVLTRINGKSSFFAYQSFDTKQEAETYIKVEGLPKKRCKITNEY